MSMTFPNESADYRAARTRLLEAEAELRQRTEEVAALRRALPPGGEVPEDYLFLRTGGQTTRMSDLFATGQDTLAIYSFMLGPAATAPCPMCAAFVDSLDGNAPHIWERLSLQVVISGSPSQAEALATGRGWRNIVPLSAAGSSYNRDYHGEAPDGSQWPMLNVFERREGIIRHFWSSELLGMEWDNHPRHMDPAWPLWTFLDWSPGGRGDFFPTLDHD
ncbi:MULTISPECIES: DUF899 family protein [unclassified Minwuia]|jgi:predicted dithiol-disulfide oxidoreductase (DUF899 family)|uniref:DUF899 family protein n=1 Tax=unclassified Minwuia TaxID=2618799 RepID=UPI00247AA782|nr:MULTISPECIES: DUF899 family protein [unclassified Minwuia]